MITTDSRVAPQSESLTDTIPILCPTLTLRNPLITALLAKLDFISIWIFWFQHFCEGRLNKVFTIVWAAVNFESICSQNGEDFHQIFRHDRLIRLNFPINYFFQSSRVSSNQIWLMAYKKITRSWLTVMNGYGWKSLKGDAKSR